MRISTKSQGRKLYKVKFHQEYTVAKFKLINKILVTNSKPGVANLFYLKRQFHSSPVQCAPQTKDFKISKHQLKIDL